MIFRKFATKKLTQAAAMVVEPAKKAVQDQIDSVKKNVGDRSDMGAKLLKFLLGGLLVIFTFKEEKQQQLPEQVKRLSAPTPNIVINNYINKERPYGNKYQKDSRHGANRPGGSV